MPVTYEWDCELVDEFGDIIDHLFGSSYEDVLQDDGDHVLVREDADGRRSWAYVRGGKIDDVFKDAFDRPVADVPERFKREVEAATAARA